MGEQKQQSREQSLDTEWIELMQAARDLGLSIEEIRKFLAKHEVSSSYS